ncbi:MAG: hypothetical protein OXC26_01155 [Albidovulum sp.]|nr:hypothetical protein [Albidovulum sp.]
MAPFVVIDENPVQKLVGHQFGAYERGADKRIQESVLPVDNIENRIEQGGFFWLVPAESKACLENLLHSTTDSTAWIIQVVPQPVCRGNQPKSPEFHPRNIVIEALAIQLQGQSLKKNILASRLRHYPVG